MDIEEDIKIVKEFNEKNRFRDCGRLNNAIDHILEEREEDKKKINKLEYCVEELKKYNKTISDRVVEYKKNRIPKRKIKDKIKEYKELVDDFEKTDNTGRFKRTNSIDYYKLEAFEELLQEEDK